MKYNDIKEKINNWANLPLGYIRFVDENGFVEENSEMVPGALISKFGFYVIATSIGGNGLTISNDDNIIRFCDHTGWYEDEHTAAILEDYIGRKYSYESVRDAQLVVAEGIHELEEMIKNGKLEKLMDEVG